jgi:transcriptional regulator with XRE-family HTH domain
MKDRLKEFMVQKSLNAADLADKIGVQRSNISHILNGRNLPGSQFIEKLLNVFPDLNADWLITGHGEMLKSSPERFHDESLKSFDSGMEKKFPAMKVDKTTKIENKIESLIQNKERRV